jgi:pilus assembly protein Flp/PilA
MTPTGRRMFEVTKRLVKNEDGAALIEYGMLVMLIALLCIIAVKTIGSKVSNGFNSANTLIP